jgi:glucose repression regulatory protein TUP1
MSIRPPPSYGNGVHRSTTGNARINDLLESLKVELESMSRESNLVKLQKEEFERKLQQQIQETQSIQAQIYDLERNQMKLKQKYDDEILMLRRQLQSTVETPALNTRNLTGEKRPLSSLEIGAAQNLESLAKRHRELSSPGPANNSANISSFPSNSLTISQIAKQAGTPKRAAPTDSPKQRPLSPPQITQSTQNIPPALAQSSPQSPIPTPMIPLPQPSSPQSNGKKPKKTPSQPNNDAETEGNDWIVGYNPTVQRRLDVKLDHDLAHDSVVCCVNFSYDAKYLATGCNHSAQIFDVKTGNKLHVFKDKPELETDLYIRSVCFSPDGKYLATGAEDKTVKLWDIEKEQICLNLTGHDLDIYSLDFLPDGRMVISGSGDKKVKIWRLEDGKCVHTLGDDQVGPKDGVTSVSISPDGRQVAAGSLDRIVRLWDIETGIFLGPYEGHSDSVYSVAFSPDGKTLASGSLDKTLKLWDLNRQQRRCRTTLNGHRDFVLSVAFSPDGNWLASGSKDRSVQFWDPRTSITHMILQGHRNSVISVAVTGEKDGYCGKFATGSGDWRARIWNFKAGSNLPQNI